MKLVRFIGELWTQARAGTPGDGRGWEQDVRELLVRNRVRSDHVPGGYSLMGIPSASGLWHQLDLEAHLEDAIVIAELKAYRGCLPKGDLLGFVAATNDLYLGLRRAVPRLPVLRAVAGMFTASLGVRTYAAQHGVVLVDPYTVPAPILAAGVLPLRPDLSPPTGDEIGAVSSLVRPMQELVRWTPAGSIQSPAPRPSRDLAFAIRTHVDWSKRLLETPATSPRDEEIAA